MSKELSEVELIAKRVIDGMADEIMNNQKIRSEIEKKINKYMHYLGDFFKCSSAPDMISLNLFPNLKEISETAAAYWAIKRHLPDITLSDNSVTVVSVGDGTTPRTAGYCAFRSGWNCISVDPKLKKKYAIDRLTCYNEKVEDIDDIEAETVVLLMVHSHAKLDKALKKIKAKRRAVVAIPCCVKMDCRKKPDMEYDDLGIMSEKNHVLIWRDV